VLFDVVNVHKDVMRFGGPVVGWRALDCKRNCEAEVPCPGICWMIGMQGLRR
jgi:hypothetical protein